MSDFQVDILSTDSTLSVDVYATPEISVNESTTSTPISLEFMSPLPVTVEMMTSGIKGDPGGQDVIYPAATVLAAHKAVSLNSSGKLVYTDVSDLSLCETFIGITLNAGEADAYITVRTFGQITDTSFSFEPDKNIFVTSAGTLTSTKSVAERYLCIGLSYAATSFYLKHPFLWEEEI